MRKSEIKNMENNDLIRNLAIVSGNLAVNQNFNMGTTRLNGQFMAICEELIKRGLLTGEDVEILKSY